MKMISENLGRIIAALAAIAVLVCCVTGFRAPVSGFFDSILDKEQAIGESVLGKLGEFDVSMGFVRPEEIEVPGLGTITVKNPNGANFTYDSSTGVLLGKTPLMAMRPSEIKDTTPMIEFTAGTFEASTNYTPGEYELESYEVTKTRSKKPVAYAGGIIISCTYVGDGTFQDNESTPDYVEQESTFIAYYVARTGKTSVNGFVPYNLHYLTIANAEDDTLENAIYLAAYKQKEIMDANNGNRFVDCNVAKWDGTKYVELDCRDEIDAITDFTETYTETVSKTVLISQPESSTEYVYVPSCTMKAVEGMTWEAWLASEYNTFGTDVTKVWDADYNEVALDSEIEAGGSYGFTVKEANSSGNVISFPLRFNDIDISDNASFSFTFGNDWDGIFTKVGDIDSYDEWFGLTMSLEGDGEELHFTYYEHESYDFGTIIIIRDSWGTGYVENACFVIADPNAYADLGLVFPEPGFYVRNVYLTSGGQASASYVIDMVDSSES